MSTNKLKIQILPSLLAADMGNLLEGAILAQMSGGNALHIDIMDGHFVPNLSMGPSLVSTLHDKVVIPLCVHLMLVYPDKYIKKFVDAGANYLFIHVESKIDVRATMEEIKANNITAGITINPETNAENVFPFLDIADQVLCMSVHPGYGGQAFIHDVLPKIRQIRNEAKKMGKTNLTIMVDGGIDFETAALCASHGANAFVAGTFLYSSKDMRATVEKLRKVAEDAFVF